MQHRPHEISVILFGLLLSFIQLAAAPATAEWDPVQRLDAAGGGNINLGYSPAGDLWALYTIKNNTTETLVRRVRPNNSAGFSAEELVHHSAGRTAAPLFLSQSHILLTTQDSGYLRLLESTNGGAGWDQKRYWESSDSWLCAAYNPALLTDAGGVWHLFYGFSHYTNIYGCEHHLKFESLDAAFATQLAKPISISGRLWLLMERGSEILVIDEFGTNKSHDAGATFTRDTALSGITGAASDEGGNIYLVRTVGHNLDLYRSTDFGASWPLLQRFSANQYYFQPKVAVSGKLIMLVWASAPFASNEFDYLNYRASASSGIGWSAEQRLYAYPPGSAGTAAVDPFRLIARNGVFTLGFNEGNAFDPRGVFLTQWRGQPQEAATATPTATPTSQPTANPAPASLAGLVMEARALAAKLRLRGRALGSLRRVKRLRAIKILLGAAAKGEILAAAQKKYASNAVRAITALLKVKDANSLQRKRAIARKRLNALLRSLEL